MSRDQNTFFSDLLQNLGFIAAAVVAFSQYALSNSFLFLFNNNENLLKISSLAALILSIAIFLGFFALRFNFLNKIYWDNKKRDKYFSYLRATSIAKKPQSIDELPEENKEASKEFVPEPFNFNLLHLAFVFIILSLSSFILALISGPLPLVSLFYVLFICFTVASISVFSIQLYRDRESQRKRSETNDIILNKIREYFVGEIRIIYDSTEPFQLVGPNRQIIFEYKDKKYRVFTKSYDPEGYFLLGEEGSEENKK